MIAYDNPFEVNTASHKQNKPSEYKRLLKNKIKRYVHSTKLTFRLQCTFALIEQANRMHPISVYNHTIDIIAVKVINNTYTNNGEASLE